MNPSLPSPRRAALIAAVFIVLVIIALLAPWNRIIELLGRLTWIDLLILGAFSLLFHLAKATRVWLTLRELDIERPPFMTGLAYMAGHPVATIPGGEAYRPALLKAYADVPASRGSAAIVLQAVVEAVALIIVSLIGALSLGVNRVPVVIVAGAVVVLYFVLSRGYVVRGRTIINKVPFVSIKKSTLRKFSQDNQRLLRPLPFLRLLAVTALTIAAGAGIVYASVHAFGRDIDIFQSALVYALPTLLAAVALVPGATEATAFGVLALLGIPPGVAAAVVLLQRLFTAVAGALLGAIAYLIVRLRGGEKMGEAKRSSEG